MAKGAIKAIIAAQFDDSGIKKAQKGISGLGKSLKGTLAGIGIGLGVGAIVRELEDLGKAAAGDVKSQALLAQQMRNTTGATSDQISATDAFIQKLQFQTSIVDDELRPAMASLVRATGDVSTAQGLLALATDVAAATGKDLGTVSIALGKAVNGQTTALFKMIPGLKGSSDWMGKLQSETKGAAEAAANNDPFQRLSVIMQDIQEQIGMALLPTLQKFASWFSSSEGQAAISGFVEVIKGAIEKLMNLVNWVAQNIQWLGPLTIALASVTAGVILFNAALDANPIMLVVSAIALLVAGFAALDGVVATGSNNIPTSVNAAAAKAGQAAYDKAIRAKQNWEQSSTGTSLKPGAALQAEQARGKAIDAVIAKYKASQKAAADAAKVKVPKITLPTLPDIKTKNSGTSAKTAADSAAAKAVSDAKAAFDAQVKAYQEAVQAAQEVINSTKEMTANFVSLFKVTPKMGEFETKTVDAFDAIYEKIKSTLADKRILQGAADSLTKYADSTLATLRGLAKQQDVLAGKIDVARTITSGVLGLANITGMLDSTTESVTSSVRTMANGIETIITKTMDVTKTGGLVDNFQALVNKTKAFAKNLIDLKKMGLNKNLFAQLVQAGADAGGATAQALVDGGSDTVSALNDLYKQLDDTATVIATETTQTLYDVGQQVVTNGFIEGLVSQQDALAAAAETLANSFASAFNAAMANALQIALPDVPMAPAAEAITSRPDPKRSPQRYAAWLAGIGGIDPIRSPQSYAAQQSSINVTVNAGLGTNGQTVASDIVSVLKQYERSNGAVWQSA